MRLWLCACALLLGLTGASVAQEVQFGTGAMLRGLDKINAQVIDIELKSGSDVRFGRLMVHLEECRYPKDDPSGDAYAYLMIRDVSGGADIFSGWMLASAPALNALEHPRYDVWVLRCTE